jgi:hypothetical protein
VNERVCIIGKIGYLITYNCKQANTGDYLTQADSRKYDDKEEQRHKHSSTHTSDDNGGLPDRLPDHSWVILVRIIFICLSAEFGRIESFSMIVAAAA